MKTKSAKAGLDATDRAILVLANEMLALTEATDRVRVQIEALCVARNVPVPRPAAPLA